MFGLSALWSYVVAGLVAALLAGFGTGYVVHRMDESRIADLQKSYALAEVNAIEKAVIDQKRLAAISRDQGIREAKIQQKLDDQRSLIPREVVRHVKDTVVCVPYGVVRVLNGYAEGRGTADESIAAGKPDDTCAAVPWRSIANDIADDYQIGIKNAKQLNDLIASIQRLHDEAEKAAAAKVSEHEVLSDRLLAGTTARKIVAGSLY